MIMGLTPIVQSILLGVVAGTTYAHPTAIGVGCVAAMVGLLLTSLVTWGKP